MLNRRNLLKLMAGAGVAALWPFSGLSFPYPYQRSTHEQRIEQIAKSFSRGSEDTSKICCLKSQKLLMRDYFQGSVSGRNLLEQYSIGSNNLIRMLDADKSYIDDAIFEPKHRHNFSGFLYYFGWSPVPTNFSFREGLAWYKRIAPDLT
jgi:hypothetical protein